MVSMAVQQGARLHGDIYEVARAVGCLPLSLVNLFFSGEPGAGDRNWVLIDAGLPMSASRIVGAAAERFGPKSRPAAIVLTHGHFDHVGDLPALAERWDTHIYCHPLERPYLTCQSSYPPPDPAVGGGAMSFLSRFYPRGPVNLGERLRTLPVDGSVPFMPGWQWIHTPGHTAGHVSLFRESDRTLIVGDAFVTTRQESLLAVLTQRQEVRRPPAYYTSDWQAARRSVGKLAALQPSVAATGHGRPMTGELLREQLNHLVEHWDREAVPAHGRYIAEPAVTTERGVEHVPPPVLDRQLVLAGGLGLAALAGCMLLRDRR